MTTSELIAYMRAHPDGGFGDEYVWNLRQIELLWESDEAGVRLVEELADRMDVLWRRICWRGYFERTRSPVRLDGGGRSA